MELAERSHCFSVIKVYKHPLFGLHAQYLQTIPAPSSVPGTMDVVSSVVMPARVYSCIRRPASINEILFMGAELPRMMASYMSTTSAWSPASLIVSWNNGNGNNSNNSF